MDIFTSVLSSLFPLIELACGIVIVIRFRGSPGAVWGGIAFGGWIVVFLTRTILTLFNVNWYEYHYVFGLFSLVFYGCLLAALITGRTYVPEEGNKEGALTDHDDGKGRAPMSISEVLFSFRGRISRSEYWLKGFLVLLPFGILSNILIYGVQSEAAIVISLLISLVTLWPSVAMMIKRCHDRNRSAWWLLLFLAPIANVWIAVEIAFLRGTVGPNRFGSDLASEEGAR